MSERKVNNYLCAVQVLNVISELFHEMPTDVIPIRSLRKSLIADRTRTSDVHSLRLVEERITFLLDQDVVGQKVIQDCVYERDVNGDVLWFVALVVALGALARIFEVHDDVEQLVAKVAGHVFAGGLLRVADGTSQAERDLSGFGHGLGSLLFDERFVLKKNINNVKHYLSLSINIESTLGTMFLTGSFKIQLVVMQKGLRFFLNSLPTFNCY